MNGYAHPLYAYSLDEFGIPLSLPQSGGWVLQREIPQFPYLDAMGCYPIFACHDWHRLEDDLQQISGHLASLAVVTDPFGDYNLKLLQNCFRDVVKPFKHHHVADLKIPINDLVSSHHRRYARKALRDVYVDRMQDPKLVIDDWTEFYNNLISRHQIKGIPAFSRNSFAKQLEVPGIVVFQANYRDKAVGMLLWYVNNNIAYYHLGAYCDLGYKLHASFALFWSAIEYFSSVGLHWINLGAGAGITSNGSDGLSRFKSGWANNTRVSYFCGRILDREIYAEIINSRNIVDQNYFPAYRAGEFH